MLVKYELRKWLVLSFAMSSFNYASRCWDQGVGQGRVGQGGEREMADLAW